jgi:citrate synthase
MLIVESMLINVVDHRIPSRRRSVMKANGLEGVIAAETLLSDVDGERGRLILAGHDVEKLAGTVSFEAASVLFLGGREDELRAALGRGRKAAFERLPALGKALEARDGMDALRAAVAQLPDESTVADVIAAVAVFAAAWARRQAGDSPVPPDEKAPHAADLLRAIRGTRPSDAEAAAFEAYLVTVLDHGMNASTFTARVVASTGSDLVSCVTAAIGALKGPLHGGAPGPVLDMLDAIAKPEQADAWLRHELADGKRIMGMGHRIYRVRDPRAAVLERALERLEKAVPGGPTGARLALARAVERTAERVLAEKHPDRPLKANVEFYTSVVLEATGVPRSLFSPIFASSRVVGWCAHVAEQRAHGRLIRPASRYVGKMPG